MQNTAWEVTVDDMQNILQRFLDEGQYAGEASPDDAESVYDEHMDSSNHDRVVEAALAYTDSDHQTYAAYHEIAAILIEEKVVQGPNPYEDDLP